MLANDHVAALQISVVEAHTFSACKVTMDLVECTLTPGTGTPNALYASTMYSLTHLA